MDANKETYIEEGVKKVLADYTQEPITLSASLDVDLGLSSFDYVEILFDLEKEFDLEIPEDDIRELETVEEIIEYIKSSKG